MAKRLPKGNPKFCIIAPTAYLDEFAIKSNRHLVLAHLVDTDPKYAEFYSARDRLGDYIIMDNGAFELGESYSPERLVDLGNECGADAIVLPDYPFKPATQTIEAAKKWIPEIKSKGFHTFFAPQSEVGDLEGWINGYKWAASNPDIDIIGMSILGIPNAMPHLPEAYARVVMTQILIDRGIFNFDKYHHYLGLNAGPALEIPSLLNMRALDSCDSSGPVWSAILGHEYTKNADSYLPTRKPKMHVDFNQPQTKNIATLLRIEHNIEMTLELFRK